MQALSLKNNRRSAVVNYLINLPAIQRDNVTIEPLDVHACHKVYTCTECLACPLQNFQLFIFAQVIDVAGIHVNGITQPGSMRCLQMSLKSFDSNASISIERQECRSDTVHFSARSYTINE